MPAWLKKTGALQGSLINHLVGLPCTVMIILLAGAVAPNLSGGAAPRAWVYLGGALGVIIVPLTNLAVPKMTAFRLTILTFVGQVFSGVLLDLLLGTDISGASFLGGILIVLGARCKSDPGKKTG